MPAEQVTLGRVAGVYGIKGWLRIASQTRPATKILDYPRWLIRHDNREFEVEVLSGHGHGTGVVVQLSGADGKPIEDRDVAAGLVGGEISVDRDALPKLPKGRYYWVDLVGLNVVNTAGESLGKVTELTSNGAQDVLVVQGVDGSERLIPFIREHIVKSVELDAGRIVCDWELDY